MAGDGHWYSSRRVQLALEEELKAHGRRTLQDLFAGVQKKHPRIATEQLQEAMLVLIAQGIMVVYSDLTVTAKL